MAYTSLQQAWLNLSPTADEQMIADHLVIPEMLKLFGFTFQRGEIVKEYQTGWGAHKVDIAARKNNGTDNFSHSLQAPSLIVELKRRSKNISPNTAEYLSLVRQLKGYLNQEAVNCSQARWGLITNADRIQLFRRHGKVIYPFTNNIELNVEILMKKYIYSNIISKTIIILLSFLFITIREGLAKQQQLSM